MATGQVGKNPFICVWDSLSVVTTSILKDGHQQGVSGVNFSSDGMVRPSTIYRGHSIVTFAMLFV